MAGLGPYLSRLREERGLSIDEMARVTRVAPRYLDALEREEFTALPASVFTKGYIRAYCQVLGVTAVEALARYAESVEGMLPPAVPVVAPAAARTGAGGARPRGTLLLSFLLLVGFGLALFVVAVLLQSGRPDVGPRRAEPPAPPPAQIEARVLPPSSPPPTVEPTPPTVSVTAPAPAVPPAPTPAAPVPTAPPPAPARVPDPKPAPPVEARPAPETSRAAAVTAAEPPAIRLGGVVSPYRLVARTVEPTWLRVRTEDGRATEETIPAGEVREWISNRPFVLTIGNAAGVALELNGQKLPLLGARGAVISRLVLPPTEP